MVSTPVTLSSKLLAGGVAKKRWKPAWPHAFTNAAADGVVPYVVPGVQTPLMHARLPTAHAVQALPHRVLSFVIGASQPSVCLLLLQSPQPVSHVPLQAPLHVRVAMWLLEHAVPHALQ
jgi:hypothetical protein